MTEQKFEVRDHRNKSMFRVDDEYLNGYAKLCGTNATLVYLCLCRHADRHQESFPSIEGMAEKLDISRDSVMRGIKSLIDWNIISKVRERRKDATWLNNRYVLIDKSVWKPKPNTQVADSNMDNQVANDGVAKSQIEPIQVAVSDTKDTHTKVTHYKEATQSVAGMNELIDLFKGVNPMYTDFFKNTTERKAIEHVVSKLGFEKTKNLLVALPEIVSKKFAPKITKPTELKRDLGKLVLFFKQESQYKNKVKLI